MLNFDLQNHRPLREIVYEQLKLQILTGKITPGTRMMEVELADEMGVSRTPILDAIKGGDADTARQTADNHVKRLKEFVIQEGEAVFNKQ